MFKKGVQFWNLPLSQDVWQIALFVIGHERWQEYPEDHDDQQYITWYIQFLHWQLSWTREAKDELH